MKQQTLMILGASYSQVPLVRAAKRLGARAIAVSIPGNYAALQEADEVVYADITDPEAVLAAAKEKKIDGITTCCMDLGIVAQGYVCETLHLPGPSFAGAKASCNKRLEKEAYKRAGVKTAPFFVVHNEKELEHALDQLSLPVMIKAVDQMGSRGVFRADTREDAKVYFEEVFSWTRQSYCLVEECLQGIMFGVEAMMSHGRLAYVLPLGNVQRSGNPPFPIGHYVPWAQGEAVLDEITAQTQKVAEALGFDDCAMDLDCMLMGGHMYVIEATARAGATCITDTVGIYYGIDYYEAMARVALGEDVSSMFQGASIPRRPNRSHLLSAEKAGCVDRILTPDQLPEQVWDLSFNISPGDLVRPMQNGRDRIGQLIVCGESMNECEETERQVLSGLQLVYQDESRGKIL